MWMLISTTIITSPAIGTTGARRIGMTAIVLEMAAISPGGTTRPTARACLTITRRWNVNSGATRMLSATGSATRPARIFVVMMAERGFRGMPDCQARATMRGGLKLRERCSGMKGRARSPAAKEVEKEPGKAGIPMSAAPFTAWTAAGPSVLMDSGVRAATRSCVRTPAAAVFVAAEGLMVVVADSMAAAALTAADAYTGVEEGEYV